ncbi:MAG: hypothetical protein KDC46_09755 [Thermoleophilia bacterium]|nr:hypothetical protein [Thermoleophilia bacterium]
MSFIDPEQSDAALADWARELGVDTTVMQRLVEQRRGLVYDIAESPRTWGFDLCPARAPRRDAATEFRRQTRLTGTLGDSFLQDHEPLLALVPDPPTMPDGTPLDEHLVAEARLSPEAAIDVARHVRAVIQQSLGRPLDPAAIEQAVREAAWDHDLDAAQATRHVIGALSELL